MKKNKCDRCRNAQAVYTTTAPLCLKSAQMHFCPTCFQYGIDEGEIVWLGDRPYGICLECEEAEVSA